MANLFGQHKIFLLFCFEGLFGLAPGCNNCNALILNWPAMANSQKHWLDLDADWTMRVGKWSWWHFLGCFCQDDSGFVIGGNFIC